MVFVSGKLMNSVPSGSAFLGLRSGFNHHFKEVTHRTITREQLFPCVPPLIISGWWFQMVPTPLKKISQLGLLFPAYGKIKNVPNQQPDIIVSHTSAPCC